MTPPTKVHTSISDHYSRAVKGKVEELSAKANTPCCGADERELGGVAAKLAGYGQEELRTLPEAAIASSFGCGNPLAFAGVQPGDVVLDLGSGAGIDLLIASEKVGPEGKVIGIDMTDDMIDQATLNIERAGATNVEVRKGLIEDMPVDTKSVDWVISNCVINLSPDKPRVFGEIFRVLKPGGRFSISDIVAEEIPESIRSIDAFYNMCAGGAISEAKYLQGLKVAGLRDLIVEDRLVYETSTLKAFLESELTADMEEIKRAIGEEAYEQTARMLDGKVWSAKFTGRK